MLFQLLDKTSAASEDWDAEDHTFTYDANGNLASQSGKFSRLIYNEFNLPIQVETTTGNVLKANYNGAGHRILKEFSGGTWTYYLREGDQTLATLNQDNKIDFNLFGLGMEGQRGKVTLSGLYNTQNTTTSETEPNNTQGTATGPIRDGNGVVGGAYGRLENQNYDWYYFEINGDGTVTYSLDAHPFYTPSASSTPYELHIYQPDGSKVVDASGQRPLSGSFQAMAGRYYVEIYSNLYPSNEYYALTLGGTLDADQHQSRFFIKDHLGSTRAVVQDNGDHLASYDYYPFGLEMPGRSSTSVTGVNNYKYTGHERDDESGINIDYMLARGYDPAVARFMQIDPLAKEFAGWTPYHYVHNNPLNLTDPTGMAAEVSGDCPTCLKVLRRAFSWLQPIWDRKGKELEHKSQEVKQEVKQEVAEATETMVKEGPEALDQVSAGATKATVFIGSGAVVAASSPMPVDDIGIATGVSLAAFTAAASDVAATTLAVIDAEVYGGSKEEADFRLNLTALSLSSAYAFSVAYGQGLKQTALNEYKQTALRTTAATTTTIIATSPTEEKKDE